MYYVVPSSFTPIIGCTCVSNTNSSWYHKHDTCKAEVHNAFGLTILRRIGTHWAMRILKADIAIMSHRDQMDLNIDSGLKRTGGKTGGKGKLMIKRLLDATIMDRLGSSPYSYHDACFTNAKDSGRAVEWHALITIDDDAGIACKEIPSLFLLSVQP